MSMNADFDRTAMVSKDSNMRQLQLAYKLIVDCDIFSQQKEILKRFVWMMSVDDSTDGQIALFVKLTGGRGGGDSL